MMQQWWHSDPIAPSQGTPQPTLPQMPPPRTADQAAIDRENAIAAHERNQHIDPDTMQMQAEQYLNTGRAPTFGMGNSVDRRNFWEAVHAAALRAMPGATGGDVAMRISNYQNGMHVIARLQQQLMTIRGNEATARLNGELYLNTADQQPASSQSNFPLVNRIGRALGYETGNTEIPAATANRNGYTSEVARVVNASPNGGGNLTDSARQQQLDTLGPNLSPAQRRSVIARINQEMSNRTNALESVIQVARERLRAGLPIDADERGNLMDENGRPIPVPGINRNAAATTTMTVGGPGGGNIPPAGGAPAVPGVTPHSSGTVNTSSDTPPTQEVTSGAEDFRRESQALFDSGATREQMDAFSAQQGHGPYGPLLEQGIRVRDSGGQVTILPSETLTPAGERAQELSVIEGQPGYAQRARAGATQGLNDEISGLASSVGNVVSSPFTGNFDPVGSYQVGRDAERIRNSDAQNATGALGTALEMGTGMATAAPAFLVSGPAEAAGLGARMIAGGRTGMITGAGSGWAHGEGLGGSLGGAAEGGAGGALIGTAAVPLAATGGAVWRAGRRLLGGGPSAATAAISDAIAADTRPPPGGVGPTEPPGMRIQREAQAAQDNGVPYMPGDSGENARGLLAASARAPGPGRRTAVDALRARQDQMGERVTGAIQQHLGPTTDPHLISDQLISTAQTNAGPLYDAFNAQPGASTFAQSMGNFLRRPAMQDALRRANVLAQNEGRDPNTAGFDVNSSGEVSVNQQPSWQTLDHVKQGLDDVIAAARHPITGRLDANGRVINNMRNTYVAAMDEANQAYAPARAAYGGPMRMNDALAQGQRSLNMNADDLAAATRDMSPSELDMFRHGARYSMANRVSNLGDTADASHALIGTDRKRLALARLFDNGDGNFARFANTLDQENNGFQTFREATQGSRTQLNNSNDSALRDITNAGVADTLTTGLPFATGLAAGRAGIKFAAGRAGDQTRQAIASALSQTNPAAISSFADELHYQLMAGINAANRRNIMARAYGVVGGEGAGNAAGGPN